MDDSPRIDRQTLLEGYVADLLAARRAGALDRVMRAWHEGYSIPGLYQDILQESLYELGRLWETNKISVADEHMGTAITQFVMSRLYGKLEIPERKRGRLLVTGVPGELHQVGANMVADLFEADGWEVLFLGTDVSPATVLARLREHRPDLLGISATLPSSLPMVVDLVRGIRSEPGLATPGMLLGGYAFRGQAAPLAGLEGCLVAQGLREALAAARELRLPGGD